MRNLIPPNTTLVTGENPVMAICDCDEQRYDDELYARAEHGERNGRDLVIMHRDGRITNRYADGIVGVTDEDREAAEIDEEPFCPECEDYIRGWLWLGKE